MGVFQPPTSDRVMLKDLSYQLSILIFIALYRKISFQLSIKVFVTIALNIYPITPILKGTYPQDTPIGQICLQTKVTPNKDHKLALFLGFTLAIRVSQIDQKSEFLYLTLSTGSYMLDEPQEQFSSL